MCRQTVYLFLLKKVKLNPAWCSKADTQLGLWDMWTCRYIDIHVCSLHLYLPSVFDL